MGQPRSPGTPTPAEIPYQQPLYPQLYPPLGYGADGTPLFVPGQETGGVGQRTAAARPGVAPGTTPVVDDDDDAAGSADAPAGGGRTPLWKSVAVLTVLGVMAAVLLVMAVDYFRDDDSDVITLPTATQEEPAFTLPTEVIPSVPGDAPETEVPSIPGNGRDTAGKQVTYEASYEGSAVILYIEGGQVRTEMMPTPQWSASFVGGDYPLRLMVVAGRNTAATCTIKVDGQVIVTDTIDATSQRRTAACRT